jgi:hypothetical protein
MKNSKHLMSCSFVSAIALLTVFLFAGCRSSQKQCCMAPGKTPPATNAPAAPAVAATPAVAPTPPVTAAPAVAAASASAPAAAPTPAAAPAIADVRKPIRINAGSSVPVTDPEGNVWLADQGFDGGDNSERDANIPIANTKNPAIYRTEHWGMSSFSQPVPNGKYSVKLHFAETWDGVTEAGQRVFSFNVEGHDFKDFDVWVKSGGYQRAYVETVNVDVTDGKLDITFEASVDNPEINGIEILPVN